MQTLTIRASTLDVADGLFVALDGFKPEMRPTSLGGYDVTVAIDGDANQLVSILEAIQNHATDRKEPALVELDGRRYALEPS
jgi:hypothetical protein